MTSTNPLDDAWQALDPPTPPDHWSGVRAPALPPDSPIYLAIDRDEIRHLLVAIPVESPPVRQHSTRGLDVATQQLSVAGGGSQTYITLACLQPELYPTFNAVAGDVIAEVAKDPPDARRAVLRSLDRWRWFWSSEAAALARDAALGLFAELWFMDRWLRPMVAETIRGWTGPLRARHDFQWSAFSVEVKATSTRRRGGVVHRIQNLDQLADPEQGDLYLFSLHVVDDALAANTLPRLVQRLVNELRDDPEGTRLFSERLEAVGYSAAHEEDYQRPFRVLAEALYRVDHDFPRLTTDSFPEGLPAGLDNVSYSLNLAVCEKWLVASSPEDPGVAFLRSI